MKKKRQKPTEIQQKRWKKSNSLMHTRLCTVGYLIWCGRLYNVVTMTVTMLQYYNKWNKLKKMYCNWMQISWLLFSPVTTTNKQKFKFFLLVSEIFSQELKKNQFIKIILYQVDIFQYCRTSELNWIG